jgi:hypothetical protein
VLIKVANHEVVEIEAAAGMAYVLGLVAHGALRTEDADGGVR